MTRNDIARRFYARRGLTRDIRPEDLALTESERDECRAAGYKPGSVVGYMLTIYQKRGGKL
jgi:hypothetical protein